MPASAGAAGHRAVSPPNCGHVSVKPWFGSAGSLPSALTAKVKVILAAGEALGPEG